MLKCHILAAIAFLAVFLGALFYLPRFYWMGAMVLVVALIAWEWGPCNCAHIRLLPCVPLPHSCE
jgi:CDP-diglyceride synthetase